MNRLSLTKQLLLFGAALVVVACGNSVGPSDKKVEYESKEYWEDKFYGLLAADILDIDDKDVITEDRVTYKLTIRFTRTERPLNARVGLRIFNAMGNRDGVQHMRDFLNSPPGTNETVDGLIVNYRLRRGDWMIERNR